MSIRLMISAFTGILFACGPANAAATGYEGGSEQVSIAVTGYVPLVCRANLANPVYTLDGTHADLGTLSEFCNNANGYRVVASWNPSLASGRLLVDGNPVELGSAGEAVVSQSSRPGVASHAISLELPQGVTEGALSFRIEPL